MGTVALAPVLDAAILGAGTAQSQRSIDRFAAAHDASHYLLIPDAVVTPHTAEDVARVFAASHASGRGITFRSGGTSLSGQAVSSEVLVDTRTHFRRIDVLDAGDRVRVQPGATVRQTNQRLSRHGRKLGPDPASEIACTIGGVIANNSSGMACGIEQNSYRTLESMVVVLPSGVILDTSDPEADRLLSESEPDLHAGLASLRSRLLASPDAVREVRRQFSMKNTMGYGLNALLDFETPAEILAHLVVGSEGTLAFVAEATFRTVEVLPHVSTGLLVFSSLRDAVQALPALIDEGFATIELMDARSLLVAQQAADAPAAIAAVEVLDHAALLVELHAGTQEQLADRQRSADHLLATLPLAAAPTMTTEAAARAAMWHVRKGLYTAIAGARPSGTTALLEDIVVPIDRLLVTCERLTALFDAHGYEGSVIFGHAKDGNLHFMLNERFDDPASLIRYRAFTEDLVELVLDQGGSLKAEHGTGRIMAPFVRRQYGDELYAMMVEIKRLFDPRGLLNAGVLLTEDPDSYLHNLKVVPRVESEVDRCVECGYCEPSCPSKDLTLTPRQRIALRRDIANAEQAGQTDLVAELSSAYEYDGVQTCAVDGLCAIACPVDINTGDLVRRLRAETRPSAANAAWGSAARAWGAATTVGGAALTVAKALPSALPIAATKVGRAILGADTVPLYSGSLPGGGPRRPAPGGDPVGSSAVFFAACIGSMFGPESGQLGATQAFLRLAERAGVTVVIPEQSGSLCCGTPWKSKGFSDGYATMTDAVLPALLEASDGGRLPIVCDAASCTEGLETMQALAANAAGQYSALKFVDATEFAREHFLPRLSVTEPVESVAIHHTCSTTVLGANDSIDAIARFVSGDVYLPDDWGCCAYAGDRGLLHPELTASATAREAAEITSRDFAAYASANRTCELGMTQATGRPYVHILELLESATR